MTNYTAGYNTRIVILTREKHYQLDHVTNISVDHEFNQMHTLETMGTYNTIGVVNVTIKQMVTNDDSCLINIMRTEPIFYSLFRDYSVTLGAEGVECVEATMNLRDEDLHFLEDDIGHVLQIDLRDNPTIYNTSFIPDGLEVPEHTQNIYTGGISIDTDALVETVYAQQSHIIEYPCPMPIPEGSLISLDEDGSIRVANDTDTAHILGVAVHYNEERGVLGIRSGTTETPIISGLENTTPRWLDKQLDLPYPFELYEFDYDFCAWCGMVKGKTSKHIDCALNAATEMFLRDLKDNIHELKKVVRGSVDVNIYGIPDFLNNMEENEMIELAEMCGLSLKGYIKDVKLKSKR